MIGYIGRTEVGFAIDRARKPGRLSPDAKCAFTSQSADEAQTPVSATPAVTFDHMAQQVVDFSPFVDATPITVHPRLPLETVMELFKKMGPRVIIIEHHGTVEGLVTIKDCLKYQFKVEAQEHQSQTQRDEEPGDPRGERLWDVMQRVGNWVADLANNLSRGRLKLSPRMAGRGANAWTRAPTRDSAEVDLDVNSPSDDYRREHEILDGTEDISGPDDDDGVELGVR